MREHAMEGRNLGDVLEVRGLEEERLVEIMSCDEMRMSSRVGFEKRRGRLMGQQKM